MIRKDENGILIRKTKSVCPVCLKTIDAEIVQRDNVYLQKKCSEHGAFQTIIWHGEGFLEWGGNEKSFFNKQDACPSNCSSCQEHGQKTCCVLLEVTSRCNLTCPICFASAESQGEDLPLEKIKTLLEKLMEKDEPYNIQLSGGEPTMRDDLAEIIRIGRVVGFEFFQLNTNGMRIGKDFAYLKKLKEAGLSCVFLQFDGMKDETTMNLRGSHALALKKQAIENCKKLDLGIILVPTLVLGINTDEIGAVLEFALKNSPTVRGVHFQPVSYFGRYNLNPTAERLTLPMLLRAIESQTAGKFKYKDFTGGGAENSYCSFHGNFLLNTDASVTTLASKQNCCGQEKPTSQQARMVVAKQWSAPQAVTVTEDITTGGLTTTKLSLYRQSLETNKFTISGMLFQDAWNLDLDRLRKCYIHVLDEDSALIPFCAYNLTSMSGEGFYRGKNHNG